MTRLFFYICLCLAITAVSCNSGSSTCSGNPRNGRDGRDGRNGVDGRNGKDGNGRDGVDGIDGKDGINGVDGLNCAGVNGTNGKDGKDGKDGINGKDGKGVDGKDGEDGKDGKNGKDAAQKNWKECAWNNVGDSKDIGLVKNCAFKKKSTTTYLKVMVTSAMRIANCVRCCKRWFVTFDGKECSPVPIDGVVYIDKLQTAKPYENDLHRPRTIAGHCKISKTGNVNVGLNIGNCKGYGDSDGYTGWNSSTHIFVEEVEPPQA